MGCSLSRFPPAFWRVLLYLSLPIKVSMFDFIYKSLFICWIHFGPEPRTKIEVEKNLSTSLLLSYLTGVFQIVIYSR